jgi:hypothetical protein
MKRLSVVRWALVLAASLAQGQSTGFLRAQNARVVNDQEEEVILRGMGLGGWMVQEAYMLGIRGEGTQHSIKRRITDLIGSVDCDRFYERWLISTISNPAAISETASAPRFKVLALAESGGHHLAFTEAAKPWLRKCGEENGFQVDYITDTTPVTEAYLASPESFVIPKEEWYTYDRSPGPQCPCAGQRGRIHLCARFCRPDGRSPGRLD